MEVTVVFLHEAQLAAEHADHGATPSLALDPAAAAGPMVKPEMMLGIIMMGLVGTVRLRA